MLLRELFEAEGKHVSFCFGRMNPPTIGHAEVFKKLKSIGGDFKIFVTLTQDKKENPLDYDTKTKFIKLIHPEYADNVVVDSSLNTIGKVCSYLYDQGYRNATFVAGSDRLPGFQKLITDYNGVEGKAHGFYKFEVLDFVSSGQRDPDSPGVSGISASKAREKAVEGDLQGFAEKTGAGQYAEELYNAVRRGMGLKDSIAAEGFDDDEEKDYNDLFGYKPLDKLYADELKLAFDVDIEKQPDIVARRFIERDGNTYKYRVRLRDGSEHDMFLTHEHGTIEAWIDESIGHIDELAGEEEYYKFIIGKLKLGRQLTKREQEFVKTYRLMHKNESVKEGKFRSRDIEDKLIPNDKLDDLKSKYLPDWEMLDHRILQAKYVAKDHRHAEEFVSYINKVSEKMDHFAEVTQDVAEVTVKTSTFDVKGLTVLDFKLALKVDKFAESNDIEQVRMKGNFGMHESSYGRYWCSTDKKWKTRKGPKQKRSS